MKSVLDKESLIGLPWMKDQSLGGSAVFALSSWAVFALNPLILFNGDYSVDSTLSMTLDQKINVAHVIDSDMNSKVK